MNFAQERASLLASVKNSHSDILASPEVIHALAATPREAFISSQLQADAYRDEPLTIDCGQTISQPRVVALMTAWLNPNPQCNILEIGTGSGYQAAILARLVNHVYSIEFHPTLADAARQRLQALSLPNITVMQGDGAVGLPKYAPFDGIIITCQVNAVPTALCQQLRAGGHCVAPVGPRHQQVLHQYVKTKGRLVSQQSTYVRFVPMLSQ